ncbi:MAG: hypothetical protein QOG35_753 [Solirubrobacteraceae bacterium]|nr:hypothetical protein [Solirubrobacteraceae bacterium]
MSSRSLASSLVSAVALLALAPASSLAAGQVALSPAVGAAGSTVVLQGSGFAPGRHVVVSTAGRGPRTVTASPAGTFQLRLGVPRGHLGWRTIVSRSAALRVVNRVFVTRAAGSQLVLEVATSGGGHVRVVPASLVPGATLRVDGAGFAPRRRIRLTWGTIRHSAFSDARGRFVLSFVVPKEAAAGASAARLSGGGVQLGFTIQVLSVAASLEPPPQAAPASPAVAASTPAPTAPAPAPGAPVNSVLPKITGTAQQGQKLTTTNGTWKGTAPITFARQWQRCDAGGATCGPIAGATATTYTAAAADVGGTLRVTVTATGGAGSTTAMSAATAVVSAIPPTAGAVALWHMDETTGTVMHDSIGGHDGSLDAVQLGVPGFLNTAYGFSTSTVTVPDAPALNPGSSTITLTIHLQTTQAPAMPDWDLFRKGVFNSVGGEYKMEYQPSGQASCGFIGASGTTVELIAGPALNDGAWHTVQCVKNATGIQVVVDGQVFSKAGTVGSISNSAPVIIGSHPSAEFFHGSLDEASISVG